MGEGIERRLRCAGLYFALERWRIAGRHALRVPTARIVSNLGPPCRIAGLPLPLPLPRTETLLVSAALGEAEIEGPAEFLLGYRPDLNEEILRPLLAAGHAPEAIAALGEGLNPPPA
jgi:mannose-6-phosphate isomerase